MLLGLLNTCKAYMDPLKLRYGKVFLKKCFFQHCWLQHYSVQLFYVSDFGSSSLCNRSLWLWLVHFSLLWADFCQWVRLLKWIIPSALVYHRFCLEAWVLWWMFILVRDTQKCPHGGPWKAAKNLRFENR